MSHLAAEEVEEEPFLLSPKKNASQFPLVLLNARKTYKDVVKFPRHITKTVHTSAVIALSSRMNIHKEKSVKPTYKSTRLTTPHGWLSNQSNSSLPFPFAMAFRMTTVMRTAPRAETS